jgi:16S rRNA (adenine(1408)-N(1))-methyltransferase
VSLDLGTGDGRLPYTLGRKAPHRLFIGIDANVAGLRELSGRAVRERLANVMYVRASVEDLPFDLAGVADRVTVVLPWGSLLTAVARPSVPALAGIRILCQPEASLSVVLSVAERDLREARRLSLPGLDGRRLQDLATEYAAAGFTVTSMRQLDLDQLAAWPSTWARRLAHGQPRPVFQIDARPTS